jgi:hypothetical protein
MRIKRGRFALGEAERLTILGLLSSFYFEDEVSTIRVSGWIKEAFLFRLLNAGGTDPIDIKVQGTSPMRPQILRSEK